MRVRLFSLLVIFFASPTAMMVFVDWAIWKIEVLGPSLNELRRSRIVWSSVEGQNTQPSYYYKPTVSLRKRALRH